MVWGTTGNVAALFVISLHTLAQAQPAETKSIPATPPVLSEIVPASGPAGEAYPLRVTIRGRGFMPAGNTIQFGPLKIPDLPSPDGSQISFAIPKLVPSTSEVPPAVIPAGEYPVRVITSAGTSNELNFTLKRNP
jgi:hypothetical protein